MIIPNIWKNKSHVWNHHPVLLTGWIVPEPSHQEIRIFAIGPRHEDVLAMGQSAPVFPMDSLHLWVDFNKKKHPKNIKSSDPSRVRFFLPKNIRKIGHDHGIPPTISTCPGLARPSEIAKWQTLPQRAGEAFGCHPWRALPERHYLVRWFYHDVPS